MEIANLNRMRRADYSGSISSFLYNLRLDMGWSDARGFARKPEAAYIEALQRVAA